MYLVRYVVKRGILNIHMKIISYGYYSSGVSQHTYLMYLQTKLKRDYQDEQMDTAFTFISDFPFSLLNLAILEDRKKKYYIISIL